MIMLFALMILAAEKDLLDTLTVINGIAIPEMVSRPMIRYVLRLGQTRTSLGHGIAE